ncbi:MAG: fumarylacetoacetate hydrolase family protein [Candidatus Poribacteria bacterium]|nr:fumarylacetoacetate hydrolase family protein [Candidatus Poribacteria bacterium]MDE0504865.1 fumarylacetoacetate hydrolase family protein [Candidatus Poribacteria bacterium]
MKIVRYRADEIINFGIMEEDGTIRELAGSPFESLNPSGTIRRLNEVQLLAPVEAPRIIGVGLNYAEHAREVGKELPSEPMLFMKPSTTVIGPDEAIIYPRQGKNVHYEAELAVVIGSPARRVSEAAALDHVLGYTCGNDVSERVIQFAEMQTGTMLIGKGFDTFCPLGPCISTDLDPGNLQVQARLNGDVKQNERTSDLIFSVAQLISYISAAFTMLPGDVIMTGTPSGVGPFVPGDVVEIEVEGIGTLRNPVVAEE